MKYILFLVLNISLVFGGFSQKKDSNPLAISASYYGDNGFHPGIKLSGYYDILNYEKSKERIFKKSQQKKGNKVKLKTYFGQLSLGAYSHANNHNGWFANIGGGYERINTRQGRLFGYSINIGYLFRDYKFDTFELSENGFEKISLAGSGGILLSFAPHFGRDLSIKTNIPLKVQVKPVLQLMQYNHGLAPNAALELEFIYNL